MKNIKSMFFVLTLITLLIAAGAVCAADDSNSTPAVDNSVSDAALNENNAVAAEPVQTTSNDKQVNTKTIEKEDKNLKTATKEVEVNNFNELATAINNAVNDAENDEIIINLNEGNYNSAGNIFNAGKYHPTIIINGNNQTITTSTLMFRNNCTVTMNNVTLIGQTFAAYYKTTILIFNNSIYDDENNSNNYLRINTPALGKIYNSILNGQLRNTGITDIFNTTINKGIVNTQGNPTNYKEVTLNIVDSNINSSIINNVSCSLYLKDNTLVNSTIINYGNLTIGDNIVFGEYGQLINYGIIEANNTDRLIPYYGIYDGDYILENVTITGNRTNNGNLSLKNCSIKGTIINNGILILDDDTIIDSNSLITNPQNTGIIISNDITKILPFITEINGNYTINNTIFNNSYFFTGNITLNNCTFNSNENYNLGLLYLNNCTTTINDICLNNYGTIIINEESNLINMIKNNNNLFIDEIPEDFNYDNKYHIVDNITAKFIFNNDKGLTDNIKNDDILDFRGTISGVTGLNSIVIDKPVNIITSTGDGRIENFSSITYNKGASGSNITGLYTYNTQFYVRNAHNMVFDNISNVVNSSSIGWGVGQTSIRENSTNITVKNSYFYTKDNGGSSTFVLAWADNCILVNSTVEADGTVGNLVYLTTYNVNVPGGTIANCNNQILNNTIRGPERAQGICFAIALSGNNNTVDGNTIHYVGTGITGQWGSGITGEGIDDNGTSLVNNSNHKIFNNKLYTNIGFTGITGCILVNNTFYNNSRFIIGNESLAINNTANNLEVIGINSIIRNNNITTNNTYTINGTGTNNTITDNYLKALDKYGDESVNLNKERNTIANNTPKTELIIDTTTFTAGQNTTIQAGIYFDGEIITNITKGKVTFKVDGKTLKDTTGKVIYAKVVNGIATIENYKVPDTWKEGSTIQAVYSGSTQCEKLNSEKTGITINKQAPTLTIDPVEPATVGSTITLKATITDNNKVINTGKIVFKINGKTVKDENGKVIYAKVVNGQASVDYTIPESYKVGTYTITATYIGTDYDKLTSDSTISVIKA